MSQEKAQYVIFVDQDDEEGVMLTASLEPGDHAYFVNGILPALRPLSDEQYSNGPAAVLHTLAKFSYILYRDDVFWCIEWDPGLIVVRFSPDGTMAWAAFRSPNPGFGGRTPSEEDLRNYNEDAENHQYNLVFHAWDAQFDERCREWRSFRRADEVTAKAYRTALQHVLMLGEQMEQRYSQQDEFDRWHGQCKQNLAGWTGEGVRLAL